MASSFLTKFRDSGQRFSRNNFIPISLKCETFTHAQLAISFNVYYLLICYQLDTYTGGTVW